MNQWIRAKPLTNAKCPVCGSVVNGRFKSGCQWTSGRKPGTLYVICLRISDGSFKSSPIPQFGRNGYHHIIQEGSGARTVSQPEIESGDPDQCDKAYRELITKELNSIHKNYLTNSALRNLPAELIDKTEYTSLSNFSDKRDLLAEQIRRKTSVKGVPGFWIDKNGDYKLSGPGGILLPVRNSKNQITGCTINTDSAILLAFRYKMKGQPIPVTQFPKYLWLTSSGKPKGVSATPILHYPVQEKKEPVKVGIQAFIGAPKKHLVVEGVLKSDVVAHFWNGEETIVGQPGSSTCHIDIVSLAGASQEVTFGMDGDWRTNSIFRSSIHSLFAQLKQHGVLSVCRFLIWDPSFGKGLDDVLQAGHCNKLDSVSAEKWLEGFCG